MNADKPRLILFAKRALPGQVKTRLQPALPAEKIIPLYKAMCTRALATLHSSGLGSVELWVDAEPGNAFFQTLLEQFPGTNCFLQSGADLGERMQHAFLATVSSRLIIVGTDCPALDTSYLSQALRALEHSEVVLGPALDGGYVLLGSRRQELPLFNHISWGSSTVLAQSVAALEQQQISYDTLPALSDIDRPGDLAQLAAFPELAQLL